MFGGNKKKETSVSNNTSSSKSTGSSLGGFNNLVHGTTIEGTVTSKSDIRVDGIIKGSLVCSSKVIIGPTGFVDGEIKCENAMIEGKFSGKLRVQELLSIKETAEINGDVFTGKLVISAGAIFNVNCNMGNQRSNGVEGKSTISSSKITSGTAKKQAR